MLKLRSQVHDEQRIERIHQRGSPAAECISGAAGNGQQLILQPCMFFISLPRPLETVLDGISALCDLLCAGSGGFGGKLVLDQRDLLGRAGRKRDDGGDGIVLLAGFPIDGLVGFGGGEGQFELDLRERGEEYAVDEDGETEHDADGGEAFCQHHDGN